MVCLIVSIGYSGFVVRGEDGEDEIIESFMYCLREFGLCVVMGVMKRL